MSSQYGDAAKWALANTGALTLPPLSAPGSLPLVAQGIPPKAPYHNGLPGLPYANGSSGNHRPNAWQGIRLPTAPDPAIRSLWDRSLSSSSGIQAPAQHSPYLNPLATSTPTAHPWLGQTVPSNFYPQAQKLPHASAFSPRGMAQQQDSQQHDFENYQQQQQQRSQSAMAMQPQQQSPMGLRSPVGQQSHMIPGGSPGEFLPPGSRLTQPPTYGSSATHMDFLRMQQQRQQQQQQQQHQIPIQSSASFWSSPLRTGLGLPTTPAESKREQISPRNMPTPPGLLNVQLSTSSAMSPQYQQISPPAAQHQLTAEISVSTECAITTTQDSVTQGSFDAGSPLATGMSQTVANSGIADQHVDMRQFDNEQSSSQGHTTNIVHTTDAESGSEVTTTTQETESVAEAPDDMTPGHITKEGGDEVQLMDTNERTNGDSSDTTDSLHGLEGRLIVAEPEPFPSIMETALQDQSVTASDLSSLAGVDTVVANATELNRAAALRLEEKIKNEAFGIPTRPPPSMVSPPLSRPPGLGPPPPPSILSSGLGGSPSGVLGSGPTMYTCPICGFGSASKFHFNSHMNTHTDHQCTMCDYTSRTEGRLKRHMKEFHSADERAAVGISPAMGSPARSEPLPTMAICAPQMTPPDSSQLSALEQMQALTRKPEAMPLPSSSILGEASSAMGIDDPQKRSGGGGGKPKNYRCKQCGHVSRSKDESWCHARTHIPPEKQLTCPKCEFVTEYKHHLEYHLRNHFGSKPFQCKKCAYSCVNKSMLNSHMKSHSNFYQYRCMDCTYATKYCHSLKLHLRKYAHRPATVISSDGSQIDPTQLDIYGNASRRGPKKKDGSPPTPGMPSFGPDASPSFVGTTLAGSLPLISAGLLAHQQRQQLQAALVSGMQSMGVPLPALPGLQAQDQFGAPVTSSGESDLATKCTICGFRGGSGEEMLEHIQQHMMQPPLYGFGPGPSFGQVHQSTSNEDPDSIGGVSEEQISDEQQTPDFEHSPITAEGSHVSSGSPISGKGSGDESGNGEQPTGSSRRKGKAFKLDLISKRLQEGKISPTHSASPTHQEEQEQPMESQTQPPSSQSSDVISKDVKSDPIRREPQSLVPRYQRSESSNQSQATADQLQAQAYMVALSAALQEQQKRASENKNEPSTSQQYSFSCQHCGIAFEDEVMYQIHMSYHCYDNPFKCNRCGHVSQNRLSHNLHLVQAKHD